QRCVEDQCQSHLSLDLEESATLACCGMCPSLLERLLNASSNFFGKQLRTLVAKVHVTSRLNFIKSRLRERIQIINIDARLFHYLCSYCIVLYDIIWKAANVAFVDRRGGAPDQVRVGLT